MSKGTVAKSARRQGLDARRSGSRRRSIGGRARSIAISTFMIAGLLAFVPPASPAAADGGEYKLDFTAAAPGTYDHQTGGGAFNVRAVGVDKDIVESLEGGDFACLEIVTYLTQIRRDETNDNSAAETLRLHFSFLADTTGQSGVAMIPPPLLANQPTINYEAVQNGQGLGGTDAGMIDDGGSNVTTYSWGKDGDPFTKGAETTLSLEVDDLEPGEWVVLRIDLQLACDTPKPTGNLQAQLNFTDVVESATPPIPDRVPGGEQTIPFKQVKNVYPVACPEQDDLSDLANHPDCNTAVAQSANLFTQESDSESSATGGGTSNGTPVVGTVTELVGTNPEVSSMFAAGGLIGLVAMRRRSSTRRRSSS